MHLSVIFAHGFSTYDPIFLMTISLNSLHNQGEIFTYHNTKTTRIAVIVQNTDFAIFIGSACDDCHGRFFFINLSSFSKIIYTTKSHS